MKKMLALFLALWMMGCGMAAAEEEAFAAAANVQVNGDLALYLLQAGALNTGEDVTDEQLDILENLIRLVNGCTFYVEADEKIHRAKVLLNEKELFLMETNGQVLLSSMLPNYGLFLPETDESPKDAEMEAAGERLENGMAALLQEMNNTLESHLVEAAEEDFLVFALGGPLSFNHQAAYAFTVGEMADAMEMFLGRAVPLLQTYLGEIGIPEEAVQLNWNVNRPADEDMLSMPLQLTLYRQKTADGFLPQYLFGELVGNMPVNTTLQVAVVGDRGEMALLSDAYEGDGNAAVTAAWESGETEEETYFTAEALVTGTPIRVDVRKCDSRDGMKEAVAKLYVKSEDAPLAVLNAALMPVDEIAPVEQGEKQLLNLAEMGEDGSQALSMDMQMGLNGLLVNAIQAAPAEMQFLLNMLTVPAE